MTAPAAPARPGRVAFPEPPRWHVVVRVGTSEAFTPPLGRRDRMLPLVLDGTHPDLLAGTADSAIGGVVAHSAWDHLDAHRLTPPAAAVDLFRAAAAVYAADARVRRRTAFDGWTREFVLHLPVAAPAAWADAVAPLTACLSFLTGDHWTIRARPLNAEARGASGFGRPPVDRRAWTRGTPLDAGAVCLLSGGLDSFAGAVDALAANAGGQRPIAFVSHNTAGSERFTSASQQAVAAALAGAFGGGGFRHLRFRVVPPPRRGHAPEDSQRSRSIIFLALGTLVASSLATAAGDAGGPVTPLIVPENGFISLNVPLTPSRLGTCSTRTTHPHVMDGFSHVLAALNLPVRLELPYRWRTKGEMLAESRQPAAVAAHSRLTNSCARPNDRNADPARPERHCGYCVPCIIRRSAMAVVGLDTPADYRYDVLAERDLLDASVARRSDVRAFEIALANAEHRGAGMADVLTAGPLPDDPGSLAEYVGVYRRGLDEVARFLIGRPVLGSRV